MKRWFKREARLEFEFDDNEIGIANVITVELVAAGGGARCAVWRFNLKVEVCLDH